MPKKSFKFWCLTNGFENKIFNCVFEISWLNKNFLVWTTPFSFKTGNHTACKLFESYVYFKTALETYLDSKNLSHKHWRVFQCKKLTKLWYLQLFIWQSFLSHFVNFFGSKVLSKIHLRKFWSLERF